MGALGLPFAEADGGMGAGPVEVSIVAEEMGRVIAPEPFVEVVVLAGGLVAAAGTDEQRADVLGRVAEGQLVLAAALAEPEARWDLSGGGVKASPVRRRLDAVRRQGAGPARCPRRRARGERRHRCRDGAVPRRG